MRMYTLLVLHVITIRMIVAVIPYGYDCHNNNNISDNKCYYYYNKYN